MADIKPFRAVRPMPMFAEKICELPYDVVTTEEAKAIAKANPLSFFRISRPEIEFEDDVDPYSFKVYQKGYNNFRLFWRMGLLMMDDQPSYYIYRLSSPTHTQCGIVGVASCEDYLNNIIKKHELTRPEKENDRMRHIEVLEAQTGPVFLVYRGVKSIDDFINATISRYKPDIDFTATDGVRHTSWVIDEPEAIEFIRSQFAQINSIYIADGHHRAAAAVQVYQKRKGARESHSFLSVLFAHHQVKILPYNRVLTDLNGHSKSTLLRELEKVFTIGPAQDGNPGSKGEVRFYFESQWLSLKFKPEIVSKDDPVEQLDVAMLQKYVLAPIFGIEDPRTSDRIQFIGGNRGAEELQRLVDSGKAVCAFSMYSVGIEELMAISDAGRIMPPKSTWFEPKLRDAMFCHLI